MEKARVFVGTQRSIRGKARANNRSPWHWPETTSLTRSALLHVTISNAIVPTLVGHDYSFRIQLLNIKIYKPSIFLDRQQQTQSDTPIDNANCLDV